MSESTGGRLGDEDIEKVGAPSGPVDAMVDTDTTDAPGEDTDTIDAGGTDTDTTDADTTDAADTGDTTDTADTGDTTDAADTGDTTDTADSAMADPADAVDTKSTDL
jgi:hypothetical protein